MARLSADGTKIIDNYDTYTGVDFNAVKTTTYYNGTPMDDSKVDNAIYFKVPAPLGGGYAKRQYEGPVRPQWWNAKGDWDVFSQTGTNNTAALQKMVNNIPNGTVVDWGERKLNYGFDSITIIGKSNLVFKGDAALSGQLFIGDETQTISFVFQMVIDGLTFDMSKYATAIANALAASVDPISPVPYDVTLYNAINLVNAFEIDITNCYQKSGNAFCYINKLNLTQHTARLRLNNIKRGRAFNLADYNQSSPNYLLYVDNSDKGVANYATVNTGLADALVTNCGSSFARICNIEGYGIDGIVITDCIFFQLPSSDKNQFKKQNIHIAKCNWLNLADCQLFEAGLEGVLLERTARFSMTNLNIAWSGERDCNFGYGFRLEFMTAGLMSGTISNLIIDEPTREGFTLGAGMHDITIDNINVRNVGSPNQYYGTGTFPVGNINNTPLLSSVTKKGGSYDITAYSINVSNSSCDNADFDFPYAFGSAIPLNQRNYCLNNRDTRGIIEKNTTFIASITTAGQILDSKYAQTIELNVGTPTGTIGGISNVRPQCFLFLGNQSSTSASVTVVNSATFRLQGGVNAVIPFGEGIMFYSKNGTLREVSRTFNSTGTVTGVSSANTDIGVANGSTAPILTFDRTGQYNWTGSFHSFLNGISIGKNTAPTFLIEIEGGSALQQIKRNSATTTSGPKIIMVRTGSTLTTDILANYILGGIQFRGRVGGVDTDWAQFAYINNSLTPGDGKFVFYKNDLITSVFDINSSTGDVTVTGVMVVPTPGTNIATTRVANTAWVNSYFAPLASPTFTGTPVLPTGTTGVTQTAGDNTTKVATTAFVTTADNLKANLASPAFTGTPSLPTGTIGITQAGGDNSTKLATTAYVDKGEILLSPPITGINTLSTGATALYTVPSGKTVIVTKVVIRVTSATAITTGPTVDIGVTAGDIYASTALTALTSLNKVFGFFSTGISMAATATQVINLNINTPAVGTSQVVECLIYGNLR